MAKRSTPTLRILSIFKTELTPEQRLVVIDVLRAELPQAPKAKRKPKLTVIDPMMVQDRPAGVA